MYMYVTCLLCLHCADMRWAWAPQSILSTVIVLVSVQTGPAVMVPWARCPKTSLQRSPLSLKEAFVVAFAASWITHLDSWYHTFRSFSLPPSSCWKFLLNGIFFIGEKKNILKSKYINSLLALKMVTWIHPLGSWTSAQSLMIPLLRMLLTPPLVQLGWIEGNNGIFSTRLRLWTSTVGWSVWASRETEGLLGVQLLFLPSPHLWSLPRSWRSGWRRSSFRRNTGWILPPWALTVGGWF